jgi:hypothetical protein
VVTIQPLQSRLVREHQQPLLPHPDELLGLHQLQSIGRLVVALGVIV